MIDDIIASGVIGEVQAIDADLCYPTTAKARITDPALAGGALLDVGVYPINFIDMIMHNAPITLRVESSMQPSSKPAWTQFDDVLLPEWCDGHRAKLDSVPFGPYGRGVEPGGYLTCQNINNHEAIDVFDGSAVTARYDVPEQLTGYEYEVASAAQAMLDGRTGPMRCRIQAFAHHGMHGFAACGLGS